VEIYSTNDLIIDWLEGYCPVQSEGTYKGIPFYFKARWNTLYMEIGDWSHKENYTDNSAGFISNNEALEIMNKFIHIYESEKQ
jgi:hypothetical protein